MQYLLKIDGCEMPAIYSAVKQHMMGGRRIELTRDKYDI